MMYNNLHWCDTLSRSTMPMIAEGNMKAALNELQHIQQAMLNDNTKVEEDAVLVCSLTCVPGKGFDKCRAILLQQEICNGTYVRQDVPCEIQRQFSEAWGTKVNLHVNANVPIWMLLLWTLMDIVLDNGTIAMILVQVGLCNHIVEPCHDSYANG